MNRNPPSTGDSYILFLGMVHWADWHRWASGHSEWRTGFFGALGFVRLPRTRLGRAGALEVLVGFDSIIGMK